VIVRPVVAVVMMLFGTAMLVLAAVRVVPHVMTSAVLVASVRFVLVTLAAVVVRVIRTVLARTVALGAILVTTASGGQPVPRSPTARAPRLLARSFRGPLHHDVGPCSQPNLVRARATVTTGQLAPGDDVFAPRTRGLAAAREHYVVTLEP